MSNKHVDTNTIQINLFWCVQHVRTEDETHVLMLCPVNEGLDIRYLDGVQEINQLRKYSSNFFHQRRKHYQIVGYSTI